MKTELSHDHLSELLPWFLNGTLSADEQAVVRQHLKTCGACQREVEWLQGVSGAMKEVADEAPEPGASFANVLAAIESSEKAPVSAEHRTLMDRLKFLWNPTVPAARLVFAAQLALIVLLGIYSFHLRRAAPGFTTLSGSEQSTGGGTRLSISFAPNAQIGEVNAALSTVGAHIVSGPSASGMYAIEVPVRAESDEQVQTIVDKLRANSAVRFVERQP